MTHPPPRPRDVSFQEAPAPEPRQDLLHKHVPRSSFDICSANASSRRTSVRPSSSDQSSSGRGSSMRLRGLSVGASTRFREVRSTIAAIAEEEHHLLDASAMPVPAALQEALRQSAPSDVTRLERSRDAVLWLFVQPIVNKIFLALAVLTIVCVVGFGLIIAWAVLGLFLGVENGWATERQECIECAQLRNETLQLMTVPACPPNFTASTGKPVPHFCTLNQSLFNMCILAFVSLFSYINFLPIPWRLAILHHAWCSHRPSGVGLDFYGRETRAVWFHVSRPARQRISLLFNVSWICHFLSLTAHLIWPDYDQSQRVTPSLAQNVPFGLSVGSQIAAAVMQASAEKAIDRAAKRGKPPQLMAFLRRACKERFAGGRMIEPEGGGGSSGNGSGKGSGNGARASTATPTLLACLRKHWKLYQYACDEHRRAYSQRVVFALTGIENEKKAKEATEAAAKLQAVFRGHRSRANTRRDA